VPDGVGTASLLKGPANLFVPGISKGGFMKTFIRSVLGLLLGLGRKCESPVALEPPLPPPLEPAQKPQSGRRTRVAAKNQWIQKAVKKPGTLRSSLGVKKGEKLPAAKLAKAAKASGKTGQRARLAQTLKGLKK
jgi:hypothetical protein